MCSHFLRPHRIKNKTTLSRGFSKSFMNIWQSDFSVPYLVWNAHLRVSTECIGCNFASPMFSRPESGSVKLKVPIMCITCIFVLVVGGRGREVNQVWVLWMLVLVCCGDKCVSIVFCGCCNTQWFQFCHNYVFCCLCYPRFCVHRWFSFPYYVQRVRLQHLQLSCLVVFSIEMTVWKGPPDSVACSSTCLSRCQIIVMSFSCM